MPSYTSITRAMVELLPVVVVLVLLLMFNVPVFQMKDLCIGDVVGLLLVLVVTNRTNRTNTVKFK